MFPASRLPAYQKKALLFGATALALGLPVYTHLQNQPRPSVLLPPRSVSALLPYYGFDTPAQKQALVFLMQQASILKPHQSLEDRFPTRPDQDALLGDLLLWVQMTQTAFTKRQGTQERWELKPSTWLQGNPAEILSALEILGMTEAVKPTLEHPDVLCVLGATLGPMTRRLHYAKSLLENATLDAKHLVLLAGERPVTINVDGSRELLEAIAKNHGIHLRDLTETHLIQEAYKHVGMPQTLALSVIDTPAGHLPRPTTETTVIKLSEWLREHPQYTSISFVSNQPHVYYQAAVIQDVLRRQGLSAIKVDVIGPAVTASTRIEDTVGALGSRIWAITPHVMETLDLETHDPKLLQLQQDLYAKQPLVYKRASLK